MVRAHEAAGVDLLQADLLERNQLVFQNGFDGVAALGADGDDLSRAGVMHQAQRNLRQLRLVGQHVGT